MIKKYRFQTNQSLILIKFIMVVTSLSSCNYEVFEDSNYKEVANIYHTKDIKLEDQKFSINLPKEYSSNYALTSLCIKETVDSTLMGIYNEKNNTIDIFNIDAKKLTHQVNLSETLVSGYSVANKRKNSINSICIESFDSIFLLAERGLYIVNNSGKSIFTINNLNVPKGGVENQIIYRNHGNFPIYFDLESKNIYMNGFCNKYSTYSDKFYNEAIEYSYNLNSGETTQLPMKFSEIFKTGYFSVSIYPSRLVTDRGHIYTFEQDPNIYIYDKSKKEIMVKGGKSKFQTETIPYFSKTIKFSKDKEMAYLRTVPSYGKLLYNPYKNLFYRFFKQGQASKNKEGLYNTELDKYESLMIFDSDFNVLNEISLERYKYFSNFSFVIKDGLLIPDKDFYDSLNNSNSLKFHLISIKTQ